MPANLHDLKLRALKALRLEEVVKLCSELVRAPSENPPGDVSEAAAVAKEWLSAQGFAFEVLEPKKGRVNVVAKVGSGEPHLVLLGHIDVVPAGDRSRWSFDPFCGEVKGGKVLGRGSTDMKGGVACAMVSFASASAAVEEVGGSLTLALVCDEETGGEYGAGLLAREGLLTGASCIITEPTSPGVVVVGERGVCWLKLKARGKPAHGSVPVLGENAIEIMMKALEAIKSVEGKRVEVPQEVSAVLNEMEKLVESLSGLAGLEGTEKVLADVVYSHLGVGGEELKAYLDACGKYTVNVGTIHGGTKVNVVAESCEAEVDVRVPIGSSTERTIELVKRAAARAAKHVDVELLSCAEPSFTSPYETICIALDRNVEEELDTKPLHALMPAVTDAHHLRPRDVPTVCYGPGVIWLAHSYNEYVPVKHLEIVTKVLCRTIIDFLAYSQ